MFLKCKQKMQFAAISSAWYNSEYVNIYGQQPWRNTELGASWIDLSG